MTSLLVTVVQTPLKLQLIHFDARLKFLFIKTDKARLS